MAKNMKPLELDEAEKTYAADLARKLLAKKEATHRDFDTGCGGRVRVYSDGRIEQLR